MHGRLSYSPPRRDAVLSGALTVGAAVGGVFLSQQPTHRFVKDFTSPHRPARGRREQPALAQGRRGRRPRPLPPCSRGPPSTRSSTTPTHPRSSSATRASGVRGIAGAEELRRAHPASPRRSGPARAACSSRARSESRWSFSAGRPGVGMRPCPTPTILPRCAESTMPASNLNRDHVPRGPRRRRLRRRGARASTRASSPSPIAACPRTPWRSSSRGCWPTSPRRAASCASASVRKSASTAPARAAPPWPSPSRWSRPMASSAPVSAS